MFFRLVEIAPMLEIPSQMILLAVEIIYKLFFLSLLFAIP